MSDERIRLQVPQWGEGTVSAICGRPEHSGLTGGCVLAHGANNDLNHQLLCRLHEAMVASGFGCYRFNFPFREQKRWPPDPPMMLEATFAAAVADASQRWDLPSESLVLGGKSLGARVATRLVAAGQMARGLLLLGYPLHRPDQPTTDGAEHFARIQTPMLFLRGADDPYCRHDCLQQVVASINAPVAVHAVAEGNHSFEVHQPAHRTTLHSWSEVVRVSLNWLREWCTPSPRSDSWK